MSLEIMLLLLMIVSFTALVIWLKLPVGLSLAATSILMAIAGGQGVPLKFLVEGMFGYLDVALVLITAMIFMRIIDKNGLLSALTRDLILKFGNSPIMLLTVITIIIMFPGAITGSCVASVLGTGVLVAPVLARLDMPREVIGAIITMAAIYGMFAPPVNVMVMIIGGGIDMPYIGFDMVLLLITLPLAILTTLFLGYSYAKKADLKAIVAKFREEESGSGLILYLPLIVVVILMIGPKALPGIFPDPRLPLTFIIGSLLCLFVGRKFSFFHAAKEGVTEILPVIGILVGVGMLIEIMTLTGVRGSIVINALSLPPAMMLLGIAVIMPLFGGISVYGGASVLGVPFALAMIGQNQIVVVSALTLIGSMGSFMPPVALTPVVTAQVIGIDNYWRITKMCVVPAVLAVIAGLLLIVFSEPVARIIL